MTHFNRIGSGYPFIFQHGLGANLNQPISLLSGLKGIELISTDSYGHGKSDLPVDTVPSFDLYSRQVYEFVKNETILNPILGGISMGAGIALKIASANPNFAKALVLVRPCWVDKRAAHLDLLLDAIPYMNTTDGENRFANEIDGFKTFEASNPIAAQTVRGIFRNQQKTFPGTMQEIINDRCIDSLEILSQIKIPVLIIGCENDPLHPIEIAEITNNHLPTSRLEYVISRYDDNNGHVKSVREIVSTFLEDILK